MLRFLGMVWDQASPQQQEAAQLISARVLQLSPSWRQEFNSPGMRVFCAGARTDSLQLHRVADDGGIVIGSLFARNRNVDSVEPDETLRLGALCSGVFVESHGRWLIDHAWGNYVAFGRDPTGGHKWVLKDPTGSLPCLRTDFRGVTVFFSRMADCVDLQLMRFSINPAFMNAHLMTGGSLQEISPLNEVQPVRRGECVAFRRDGSHWHRTTQFYWNPLTFKGVDDVIENPHAAACAIRNAVKSACASFASEHPSVLLRLSGGLDSSIIAGCLKGLPTARYAAYTYFSPSGRSDERPWARLAAQHSGCEHIEVPLSPLELDLRVGRQMAPTFEPSPLLSYIQRSTIEPDIVARTGATGIFNGEGGDSGFCSDSVTYAVPEYLKNHGLRTKLFQLASQVALLTQKSSWSVLTHAVRRNFTATHLGIPRERILAACQLVSEPIKHEFQVSQTVSHPWFKDQPRVPWDKLRRLGTLISSPDYYNVAAAADAPVPELVSPLYAQPVMELLLRIPIYVHFNGGRDRGLARDAFTAEVPEPILKRLWKDRAPGFHDQMIERQRSFLQETLLEGSLAHNGLLNRALLEEVIAAGPSKNTVYPGELFRHLDTELWARHWLQGSRQQIAA